MLNDPLIHETTPPGFSRSSLTIIGSVSFMLAPQLPYLTQGAVQPVLAAALTIAAAIGLGLLASRRLGKSVGLSGLTIWCALALSLWAPAMIPSWSSALAPLAQIVAIGTLAGGALVLRGAGDETDTRRRPWSFLVVTAATLVLADVGRSRLEGEPVQLWWALLWALLVLVALIGWGWLIARVLFPAKRPDWGLAGVLGLAAACAAGGVANLSWTVSTLIVELFLALGVAGWVTTRFEDRATSTGRAGGESLHPGVTVLLIAAIALQLAGAVAGVVTVGDRPPLDRHDDTAAYAVFPRAMLETGSIGPQPWEGRRMLSLGAQSGLQCLILVANPLRAIHLLDAGVAMVLLVGLVVGAARRRELSGPATALVVAVALTAPHIVMRGNSSAVLTGALLLLALFRLLDEAPDEARRAPAGLALVAAAAIAVKSTLAPAAVVAVGIGLLAPAWQAGRRRHTLAAAIGAATAVWFLLLPWMVSILESSGTLLYPIFGRGFYGGVYDSFSWSEGVVRVPISVRLTALVRHGITLLPALVLLAAANDRRPRRAATAIFFGAITAVVALVVLGDPFLNRALARYSFPLMLAATLGLLTAALSQTEARRRQVGIVVGVAVAVLLTLGKPADVADHYVQLVQNVATAISAPWTASDEERAAMAAVEELIPPDGMMLATLEHPWLLDPNRVQLRILSLPGMSSPPPGLPLNRGPAALASALEQQGVRYLAYGGQRELTDLLQLTEQDIRERYPQSKMRWTILRGHQRYRSLVRELAGSRKLLYDDGRRIVLDLAEAVSAVIPRHTPERCSGLLEGDWTTGDAVIRGLSAPTTPAFVIVRTAGRHPAWRDDDPTAISVAVGDLPLPMVDSRADARVYRLDSPPPESFDLHIRSTAVPPPEIGARAGGPALGVDISAVEVVADPRLAATAIHTIRQAVRGNVDCFSVWRREGFFQDYRWTNGDARLENIEWRVAPEHDELEVELFGAHPAADQPEILELRITVDGLELEPVAFSPRLIRFRLPPWLEVIHSVRIRSSTFIPSERSQSDDDRTLGVPIRRLTLR